MEIEMMLFGDCGIEEATEHVIQMRIANSVGTIKRAPEEV